MKKTILILLCFLCLFCKRENKTETHSMGIFDKLFNRNKDENTTLNDLLLNKSFKNFITEAENISIGYSELNFLKADNIKSGQIGFSIDKSGKPLISKKPGDWKKNWIVIATDDLGDPIFVDSDNTNLSVFISQHGQGAWKETYIASSLEIFKEILSDLKRLSIGRDNPIQIEKNPITEIELNNFLAKCKTKNTEIDIWFWEDFLENDAE
ncbi:MAG: SMI1/KNR4 family protein [Chitinophagales bacterium]|nr:SMI1/KNR4 family protein [Chitinophagales bacterium]